MNDEHPFVQEVRANPQDDAPRLIFADYLDEVEDPRGELIRVQVALSRQPPGDPARRELELREIELLDEYADEWLAPLRVLGAQGLSRCSLQRGLIERIRIDASVLGLNAAEICRVAPALHWIELRKAGDALASLAKTSLPSQITAIDLSTNRLNADLMGRLASAVWTGQIRQLSLAFNQLTDQLMSIFAISEWPSLNRLNLNVNKIGAEGIWVMAPALPHLEALSMNANPLGDAGLERLANSSLASNLRELEIGATGVTAAGIARLAASPLAARLESLVLRGNLLETGRDWTDLASMPRLRQLDLRGTYHITTATSYGTAAQKVPTALRDRLGDGLLW